MLGLIGDCCGWDESWASHSPHSAYAAGWTQHPSMRPVDSPVLAQYVPPPQSLLMSPICPLLSISSLILYPGIAGNTNFSYGSPEHEETIHVDSGVLHSQSVVPLVTNR